MFEDPVTGFAHSTLVPIWSNKLGKINYWQNNYLKEEALFIVNAAIII